MANPKQFADAIRTGDLSTVEALIRNGADVNVLQSEDYPPPLYVAIEHQQLEIVRLLIARGSPVNKIWQGGPTPLTAAIDIESDSAWQQFNDLDRASTELTELLLSLGAEPTKEAFELARGYGNHRALAVLERYATQASEHHED